MILPAEQLQYVYCSEWKREENTRNRDKMKRREKRQMAGPGRVQLRLL